MEEWAPQPVQMQPPAPHQAPIQTSRGHQDTCLSKAMFVHGFRTLHAPFRHGKPQCCPHGLSDQPPWPWAILSPWVPWLMTM